MSKSIANTRVHRCKNINFSVRCQIPLPIPKAINAEHQIHRTITQFRKPKHKNTQNTQLPNHQIAQTNTNISIVKILIVIKLIFIESIELKINLSKIEQKSKEFNYTCL